MTNACRVGSNAILAFWLAYILTRPLGASIGDLLSQPTDSAGLGLGTVWTSLLFLVTIAGLVGYLTVTRKDETKLSDLTESDLADEERAGSHLAEHR